MARYKGSGSRIKTVSMEKCIIVAIADNMAIGKDNSLLWHISEDLQYFKKTTLGCPVVMGRRTFESLGRPLPKRTNIVVTRSASGADSIRHVFPDVIAVHSMEEAFEVCGDAEKCFVIGGGEIYRQSMETVDRLYITEVHTEIGDADTFFPEISPEIWRETSRSDLRTDENTGLTFEFVIYDRK